ncbi:hypothetical protein U1Q18_028972 [Sarracenia purpurea var. burkii]
MESKEKVELIQLAIQQLMDEQREKKSISPSDGSSFVAVDDGDDDQHILLSRLLSQLETLKWDGKLQQPEPPVDTKELHSPTVGEAKSEIAAHEAESSVDRAGREELIRELTKVKRQNFITHCLLSVMIVLTAAWQLSEFSLVLKVKNRLNNPFKSFGSILTGLIKGRIVNAQNGEKHSVTEQQQIEGSALPYLKIPELAHLNFPLGDDSDDM